MVIVTLARTDLRDEIDMATEAFALSPISARAAEPNEQDYDAIREAFMETARGRWFLNEYAKRNRNADTSMVLDAVARIEETLAAQRQPVVEDRLPEALVAIRRAVADAEAAAGTAFDRAALEASLGPINRGVRIIKEISWRWREIGADGRICDLIDSQLSAIESACVQISSIDPRAELTAAFALLKDQVERTGAGEAAAPQAAAAATVRPAPAPEAPKAEVPTDAATDATAAAPLADVAAAMAASQAPAPLPDTAEEAIAPSKAEAVEAMIGIAEVATAEASDVADIVDEAESRSVIEASAAEELAAADMFDELQPDAAAEADDDAVLEMVALEMAAPDPDFDEAIIEPAAADIGERAPVEIAEPAKAEIAEPMAAAAQFEEPVATAPGAPNAEVMADVMAEVEAIATAEMTAPVMERPLAEVAQVPTLPMPSPVAETSLGASILASGMLQKPRAAANDPLAPIRRMSQAEKIAFFS